MEGEWSINHLTDKLYEDGLRTRPTKKRPAGKVNASTLHEILRDPYYIGIVTYGGVEYEGTHEPLIDKDTFSRVQAILTAKQHAGEKQRRHLHYLKGTIHCGHCRRRMSFSRSRGNGGTYDYFMCAGRHSDRSGCPQRYIRTDQIEDAVARLYGQRLRRSIERIANLLREQLITGFEGVTAKRQDDLAEARRKLTRLEDERRKLLQLVYDGRMPDDLFGEEQDRLKREIEAAKATLERATVRLASLTKTLDEALTLARNAEETYETADPALRRQLNQAFFERVYIRDKEAVSADLADPYADLLDGGLANTLEKITSQASDQNGLGSREKVLVEPAGLEPATSCLQSRRSSS